MSIRLLQSAGSEPTSRFRNITRINLLPALPSSWPDGSFKGGRARDGLRLDATWSGAKLTKVTLTADRASRDLSVALKSVSFTGARVLSSSCGVMAEGDRVVVRIAVGETVELGFARA